MTALGDVELQVQGTRTNAVDATVVDTTTVTVPLESPSRDQIGPATVPNDTEESAIGRELAVPTDDYSDRSPSPATCCEPCWTNTHMWVCIVVDLLYILTVPLNLLGPGFLQTYDYGFMEPRGRNFLTVFFVIIGVVGVCNFKKYLILATGIWYILTMMLTFFGEWFLVTPWFFDFSFAFLHFGLFVGLYRGKITSQHSSLCCDNC